MRYERERNVVRAIVLLYSYLIILYSAKRGITEHDPDITVFRVNIQAYWGIIQRYLIFD